LKRLSRVDRMVLDHQLRDLADDVARARASIAPMLMKSPPGEDMGAWIVRASEAIGRTAGSLEFIEKAVSALRTRLELGKDERL
jgi:hypothetical protein